jgi:hypothetical protein
MTPRHSYAIHPLTRLAALAASVALLASAPPPALAHGPDPSATLSAASALPVAVVVAGPALLLSGAAQLTVVSVQASAQGTTWVLARASDGVQATLQLSGALASGVSTVAGATVVVSALGTGWLLSQGAQVLGFVPNARGQALLHHQRVSL